MALSLPSAIGSEPDIHRDVLDKLAWGNLYIYYQEGTLAAFPPVPARMYPITLDEIHSGWVKGKERLITARLGVYGWRGDRDLHFVSLFDARRGAGGSSASDDGRLHGRADPCGSGAKTSVPWSGRYRCALSRPGPFILHVSKYDEKGCELVANGRGPSILTIRSGDFPIRPGTGYVIRRNGRYSRSAIATHGSLSFSLELADEVRISIKED